jgi:hypothetical protein
MGLDIRIPIGLMFSVFGALLILFGLISDKRIYEVSLGTNVNLIWGVVLLIFGGFMLLLAKMGSKRIPDASAPRSGEQPRRSGH